MEALWFTIVWKLADVLAVGYVRIERLSVVLANESEGFECFNQRFAEAFYVRCDIGPSTGQ